MTPKQQYYKNIADTMISNLKKRGFEAGGRRDGDRPDL